MVPVPDGEGGSRDRVEVCGLHTVILRRLDPILRPEGDVERLLGVQAEIPKAQRVATLGVFEPAVVDGDHVLAPGAQWILVQRTRNTGILGGKWRRTCQRDEASDEPEGPCDAQIPLHHRRSAVLLFRRELGRPLGRQLLELLVGEVCDPDPGV